MIALALVATLAVVLAGAWWWRQRTATAGIEPAPSRPLDRVLVMPIEGFGFQAARPTPGLHAPTRDTSLPCTRSSGRTREGEDE